MSTPPNPAPPKRSDSLWLWAIALIAAAFLILGAGALVVTRFMVKRVEISRAGSSVEIDTAAGSLKASKDETADPGLPIFLARNSPNPEAQSNSRHRTKSPSA